MRILRLTVLVLLVVALTVTSLGWYLTARGGADARFDSCRLRDGHLDLAYSYGANEEVSVRVDTREEDGIIVSLETRQGGGDTPAIGLGGTASFAIFGDGPVRYPDGTTLTCEGT